MITGLIRWKDKMAEPLDEWHEKLRQHWLSLNPRERLILSILVGIMSLLVVALVVKESTGFLIRQASMSENNFKNVERIQLLSQDLLKQRAEISRYDLLKTQRGESFKMVSFIEAEAAKAGVTIAKMAPTKSRSTGENGDEEWVEVQLSKETNLPAALRFLSGIESMIGVQIVELSMRPQFTDPTKLEISAIVANLKDI